MQSDLHAIILAAGASDRMGRDKAALPWLNDSLLLPWMVETLAAAGWRPVVVLGPRTEAFWRHRLPGVSLCLNSHPERGKTTSVIAGLQTLPQEAQHFLITAVDQPRPPALYRLFATLVGTSPILLPDNNGHRGHPVVLARNLRESLGALHEHKLGLRGFLDEHRAETALVPCPAGWLRWDFNTPDAYNEALAWFRAHQSES